MEGMYGRQQRLYHIIGTLINKIKLKKTKQIKITVVQGETDMNSKWREKHTLTQSTLYPNVSVTTPSETLILYLNTALNK